MGRWWLLLLGIPAAAQQVKEPVFPYGAVYFRKSNPPEEDWEKDHKTAAEAGIAGVPALELRPSWPPRARKMAPREWC